MKKAKSNKAKRALKTAKNIKKELPRIGSERANQRFRANNKDTSREGLIAENCKKVLDREAAIGIFGEQAGWDRYRRQLAGMPNHRKALDFFVQHTLPTLGMVDCTMDPTSEIFQDIERIQQVIRINLPSSGTECIITILKNGYALLDYFWTDSIKLEGGTSSGTRYGSMQINLGAYLDQYSKDGLASEFTVQTPASTDRKHLLGFEFSKTALYSSEGVLVWVESKPGEVGYISWFDFAYLIRRCMQVSQNIFER